MSPRGPDPLLEDLLLDWEESLSASEPLSTAELCRNCPELAGELERKIARLKTVDGFLFSTRDGAGAHPIRKPGGDAAPRLPELPGYEVLEELGRGGMGVVYKARQKSLGRFVAVKTLAGSRWARPGSAARLRQEAQALSRLNHPHVVQVLDVVETESALSVVLEYVEGESLAQRLGGSPMPARDAAQLMLTLARALTAVHEQGLLHRDIKPGNVLLGRSGEIKISDFGLAKESGSTAGLTVTGEILGSPSYMAPEQVQERIDEIDVRTDVYAMGATLYEMLSGRPPFQAASHAETFKQVIDSEPVSPRLLNPGVPPDLETICLRCLEKAPARRFATAGELAEELKRYLRREPIRSRPIGTAQRLMRWCRRRPAAAALIVVSTAAVLAIAGGLVLRDRDLTRYNDDLKRLNDDLMKSTVAAQVLQRRAEENESRARDGHYAADVNRAAAALREADTHALAELLDHHVPKPGESDRRGFEWWYLNRQANLARRTLLEVDSPLYILCLSPDRCTLAAAGKDAIVRLIDPVMGGPSRDIVTGQIEVNGVAFSPDGSDLATAGDDGSIKVWDLETGAERLKIPAHPGKAFQVLFTPDGLNLVSCGDDPVIRVFAADSGKGTQPLVGHQGTVEEIVLSKDGRLLASTSGDGSARTWDLPTGEQRNGFACDSKLGPLVMADDLLITGRVDGWVQTWSLSQNREIGSVSHRDQMASLALHPSGTPLAAGDRSGSIRLWNVDSEQRLSPDDFRSWPAHRGRVASLVWEADGSRLLSAGEDGRVMSWSLAAARREPGPDRLQVGRVSSFCLIPGTDSLIAANNERDSLVRWNWVSRQEQARLPGSARFDDLAASPDGQWIEMQQGAQILSVHAIAEVFARTHEETAFLKWESLGKLGHSCFSPDSQTIAVVHRPEPLDGTSTAREIWLHGPPGFGKREQIPVPVLETCRFAFAPDGTRLVLATDTSLVLWDLAGRRRAWTQPETDINSVAFSPDGNLIVTGSRNRTLIVRNAPDGTIRDRLTGHRARITCVAFSPDSRTLASASNDGAIKLWHVPTGQEVLELRGASGGCRQLEFSGLGRHLLALVSEGPQDVILVFCATDDSGPPEE